MELLLAGQLTTAAEGRSGPRLFRRRRCQEVGQPISPIVVGDFAAARGRAPQVLEELVVAVRLIPKGLQRMKGYARPRQTDSGSAAMIRLTVAAL